MIQCRTIRIWWLLGLLVMQLLFVVLLGRVLKPDDENRRTAAGNDNVVVEGWTKPKIDKIQFSCDASSFSSGNNYSFGWLNSSWGV